MSNNELYGDEDFLPTRNYERDEDEEHEDYIQRVFEHDHQSVVAILNDGFFTQTDFIQKMTSLLSKARSEGNYPYV